MKVPNHWPTRWDIRGKRYRVIYRKPPPICQRGITYQLAGDVDHPQTKGKQMRIDPALTGVELLAAIMHEYTHPAQWDLCEDAVREITDGLAAFVWRFGYRLPEDAE